MIAAMGHKQKRDVPTRRWSDMIPHLPRPLPLFRAHVAVAVIALAMVLPSRSPISRVLADEGAIDTAQVVGPATTGPAAPGMEAVDAFVGALMERWGIPGGAVAVARNGRLVFAHGYGIADRESGEPARPESLFRVASLSKSVTAATILALVGEGKLDLEAQAFPLLDHLAPPAGTTVNPRLSAITVRQLLHHAGGWDRDISFDPMFIPTRAASAVGVPPPASCETVIRYMWSQPLQFDPGTRYAYSNFGYCVLGRIIEKLSGVSYAEYATSRVLAPAGAGRMLLGRTLPDGRAPGEVRYYDVPGAMLSVSAFPGSQDRLVPWPYGGFHLEAMDAHGGWAASVVDYLRYVTALDGSRMTGAWNLPTLLGPMMGRPAPPVSEGSAFYYGMGWLVRPVQGGANLWHAGSLPGTMTYVVRLANGVSWAAFFNTRVRDSDRFFRELDEQLNRTLGAIRSWPDHDLFSQLP
jgi:CubicO group peptidase (beta-lactamase class C family)